MQSTISLSHSVCATAAVAGSPCTALAACAAFACTVACSPLVQRPRPMCGAMVYTCAGVPVKRRAARSARRHGVYARAGAREEEGGA